MLSPIKRLQKLSAIRRDQLAKAGSVVQKMKDQAEAAQKVSQQIQTEREQHARPTE